MNKKIHHSEHDKIRERIGSGVPLMQIAKEYGVSYQAIYYIYSKAGSKKQRYGKKPTDDELYTLYVLENKMQTEIAEIFDVTPSTVSRWVKDAELEKEQEKDRMPEDLIWQYEYGGCSAIYLAEHYGFTYDQVRYWLDKHGAKKRTKGYQPRKKPATFARKGEAERGTHR